MTTTTTKRPQTLMPPFLAPFPYLLGTAYLKSLKTDGTKNVLPPLEVVTNDVVTLVQKQMELGAAWLNLWSRFAVGVNPDEDS